MLVKTAFSGFWIDERLEKKVLEPLSNYAPKFSETRNTYSLEPEHNWASHMSDAVRYMVIALQGLMTIAKPVVARPPRQLPRYMRGGR